MAYTCRHNSEACLQLRSLQSNHKDLHHNNHKSPQKPTSCSCIAGCSSGRLFLGGLQVEWLGEGIPAREFGTQCHYRNSLLPACQYLCYPSLEPSGDSNHELSKIVSKFAIPKVSYMNSHAVHTAYHPNLIAIRGILCE